MRLRTRTAPATSNPQAAALIKQAEQKCDGCRTWWRKPHECAAKVERQALREIAARRMRA